MELRNLKNLYANESLFLLCSGPSLAGVDHELLDQPGIITMGVNNSPSIFRPNLWVHVDPAQKFLQSVWDDPAILKFSPRIRQNMHVDYAAEELNQAGSGTETRYFGAPIVNYKLRTGFQAESFLYEDQVCFGNSGKDGGARSVLLAAIKIAYLLGFRNIYLLGADFKMEEGKQNYAFEQDRSAGSVRGNNRTYRILQERFGELKPFLQAENFNIYNCTEASELKSFPYLSLENAVKKVLCRFSDPDEEVTFGRYDPKKKKGKRRRIKRSKQLGLAPAMPEARRWRNDIKIDVRKQIALTGMSRSGTHAVSDWIAAQHTGRVEFRNNLFHRRKQGCELYDPHQIRVPKRWYWLPSFEGRQVDTSAPIDAMVYTYENQPGIMFDKHDLIRSEETVKIALIRDPFNLLATLGKHVETGRGYWFARKCTDADGNIDESGLHFFAEMWLSHAALAEREDVIPVLYNKWKDSEEYRNQIAEQIGVDIRTDESMKNVPTNGKGSSFDKKDFDGRGSEMDTLGRWRHFENEAWYQRFFQNNPEVVAASERLFGTIEGTEELLKAELV